MRAPTRCRHHRRAWEGVRTRTCCRHHQRAPGVRTPTCDWHQCAQDLRTRTCCHHRAQPWLCRRPMPFPGPCPPAVTPGESQGTNPHPSEVRSVGGSPAAGPGCAHGGRTWLCGRARAAGGGFGSISPARQHLSPQKHTPAALGAAGDRQGLPHPCLSTNSTRVSPRTGGTSRIWGRGRAGLTRRPFCVQVFIVTNPVGYKKRTSQNMKKTLVKK